jgi:hypothetical protein
VFVFVPPNSQNLSELFENATTNDRLSGCSPDYMRDLDKYLTMRLGVRISRKMHRPKPLEKKQ